MQFEKGDRVLVEATVLADGPDGDGEVLVAEERWDGYVSVSAIRPWSDRPQPAEPPVGSLARAGELIFLRLDSGSDPAGWFRNSDWISWQGILAYAADESVEVEVRTPDDIWGKR